MPNKGKGLLDPKVACMSTNLELYCKTSLPFPHLRPPFLHLAFKVHLVTQSFFIGMTHVT